MPAVPQTPRPTAVAAALRLAVALVNGRAVASRLG